MNRRWMELELEMKYNLVGSELERSGVEIKYDLVGIDELA